MADDIDLANERAQIELDNRIAAARNNVPHEDGPEHCTECDERIPLQRRRLGYAVCVPCAAAEERRRQMHRSAS